MNFPRCLSHGQVKIIGRSRLLWEQHSTWTGMTITGLIFNLPNKQETVNRLLRNPIDFQEFLKKFYELKIADNFKTLLTEHLELAANYIEAILNNDKIKRVSNRKKWYENANEISTFLASINPCWKEEDWKAMFYEHLCSIEMLVDNLLKGNFDQAVKSQDLIEKGTLEMADLMANGLIKQFCC